MQRVLVTLVLAVYAWAVAVAQPRDYYADAEELYYSGSYSEAIKVALEGTGDDEISETELIDLYSILGSSYARLGAFDKAADYMIRCYQSDKANGEVKGLTSSLVNLASMYVYAGEPNLAKDYALEAISNESNGPARPEKLAMAYGKACDVFHAIGDDNSALSYANQAVTIARESLDDVQQAIRRSQRAYALSALGMHDKALEDLRFCERTFRKADVRQSLAIVCFQLGQEYGYEGRSVLERQYLKEAADIARELKDKPLLQKILSRLSESLRSSSPEKAWQYLKEASTLQEEIAQSKSNNALELFNIEYETSRREHIIELQTFELTREKRRRTFLLIIAVLLLGAVAVVSAQGIRIRRSERKLRQSNAQKDFLFKVISHDLHAPAVAQLRGIQLVRSNEKMLTDESRREVFLQLERQAESEVELIDNVLRWARSKSGTAKPEAVRFVLDDMVREVIAQHLGGAQSKAIGIRLESPGNVVVNSVRSNLMLALRNLLSNAVKFSPREGQVVIRIEPVHDGAFLRVVDHGIGIPADKVDHIFDTASTFRRSGTDGEPSNGLGLAVSRDLVEETGSSISVESTEGKGSTFTIHIKNLEENA